MTQTPRAPYVPLRIFSPYSVGFGAVRLDDLTAFATDHGIPAAGISDRDSLGGAMRASAALEKAGLQPIIGTTLAVRDGSRHGDIVLIAQTQAGYDAILAVVNRSNLAGTAAPDLSMVLDALRDAQGVIALTGGPAGLVQAALATSEDHAKRLLDALASAFPDRLYVEIQRPDGTPAADEEGMRLLARQRDLPLVATQSAHYASAADCEAHDVFLCIADKTYRDAQDRRMAQEGHYLVSPGEMETRFADLPEAVANTSAIARRCAHWCRKTQPRLPAFETSEGAVADEADHLRQQAREGLTRRLARLADSPDGLAAARTDYETRLETELDIIVSMGFPGYFLIVADFIGWARGNGISVGPGRGSGAGSLVAYALGITDIDPLRFGLLFERFLNPERVSMPDFDIDFPQADRERVIDYVRGKYGADRVAHIATFGTLQTKAVVRDVGRVLGLPFPVVDRLAKMIPANPANPISVAEAAREPALAREIEAGGAQVGEMFEIAERLEGLYRHTSIHAAGVIIADRPVGEVVPVHLDQNGALTTSFEMKSVEEAGLVKFDFLGLKNLDIIAGARAFAAAAGHALPDLDQIGFDDPETLRSLREGDGFGVFQLESDGMQRAMSTLGCDSMDDLIALISLYRPGPMDQIATYADRKHGREPVRVDHPSMESVLAPTYGVMIYQEQVMEIARIVAGYSLGDADLLRRAMGKKIAAEMDIQRDRFQDGASAGWVSVTCDDGSERRLHARTRVAARDGTGRLVSLQEALDENLDVAL